MPIPDMQPRFRDLAVCEFCGKSYTDDKFVYVLIDNDKDGEENEKRIYEMCENCREKCRNDPIFEKSVTEKAFSLRLGRKVRLQKVRSLSERLKTGDTE